MLYTTQNEEDIAPESLYYDVSLKTDLFVTMRLASTLAELGVLNEVPEARPLYKLKVRGYKGLNADQAKVEFRYRLGIIDTREPPVFTQEMMVSNVERVREIVEQKVGEALEADTPRELANNWLVRKLSSTSVVMFDADENFYIECEANYPTPKIWCDTLTQAQVYRKQFEKCVSRAIVKGRIKEECKKFIRFKFYDNVADIVKEVDDARKEVRPYAKVWIRKQIRPILKEINRELYNVNAQAYKSYLPPSVHIVNRYREEDCMVNYNLYRCLLGEKSRNLHASVSRGVYDVFSNDFIEGFASPWNKTKQKWCSLFNYDEVFGSQGNLFRSDPKGKYLLNPPFLDDFLEKVFDYFKEADAVFLFVLNLSRIRKIVERHKCNVLVVPAELFEYEEVFGEKDRKFVFPNDTYIVYWGTNKEILHKYATSLKFYFKAMEGQGIT